MRWKKIFYSLTSVILLILSFPKFSISFLAWFALVPLFLVIRNSSPKQAFLLGFLSSFFTYLGLLYWIVITIVTANEPLILGILCLFLLSAYLSLYFALFSLIYNFFSSKLSTFNLQLLTPCVWVFLEYIRSHLFSGFPWALLGYTQWNFLPIIQISEFTGVYGVSFLIVLVNTTLVGLRVIGNRGWRRKIKIVLPTFVLFLLSLGYGLFSLKPISYSLSPITIVLLQGNIDQYKKWSKEYEKEIMDKYTQLTLQAVKEKPNLRGNHLIIWPESAIPGYLFYERHLYEWVKKIIRESACYHLIGSVHYKEGKLYNSVFLFSPQGKLIQEYDKIHLVPFSETIPLKIFLSKYIKVLNELGDFSPGKDFTIFTIQPFNHPTIQPITFSANICFEAIFPQLIRKFVKRGGHLNGAEIIINLTNDAWFLKTSAPYQHFTMNIFRAVENRKYVVRCANTGISAFIDPYGRIIKQTPIFTTLTLSEQIYPENKKTFYIIYGDIFTLFCFVIILAFLGNLWYIKK